MRLGPSKIFLLGIYYAMLYHLPASQLPVVGCLSRRLRYAVCRRLFRKCGHNVNIDRKVFFGTGKDIEIDDNSGIGMESYVPDNICIGRHVIIGPHLYVLAKNHNYDRLDVPIGEQGYKLYPPTVIEDNVWIGRNVSMTPGRHVKKGTIIGMNTLLTKDFPPYSIVGGNPGKLLKTRS